MLSTFIASSNLRNILTSPRLPPVLQHCSSMFHDLLRSNTRNTLTTEMMSTGALLDDQDDNDNLKFHDMDQSTSTALRIFNPSLLSRRAHFYNRIERDLVTFAKADANLGDSLVMVTDDSKIPFPASIQAIFVLEDDPDGTKYVSISRFCEIPSDQTDPYARYPIFGSRLWSKEMSRVKEVMPLSNVIGHVTRKPYSDSIVVITPLRTRLQSIGKG